MLGFSTRTRQALIVAFCLWHMTAVALYVVPGALKTRWSPIGEIRSLTDPYVLMTSQWQQWNIFSPNPLRRVSTFRVESTVNGVVGPTIVDSERLSIWRRAKELKVLYRLEEEWASARETYLLSLCGDTHAQLQLLRSYRVLPADLGALGRVATTTLPVETNVLASVTCP